MKYKPTINIIRFFEWRNSKITLVLGAQFAILTQNWRYFFLRVTMVYLFHSHFTLLFTTLLLFSFWFCPVRKRWQLLVTDCQPSSPLGWSSSGGSLAHTSCIRPSILLLYCYSTWSTYLITLTHTYHSVQKFARWKRVSLLHPPNPFVVYILGGSARCFAHI